MHIHNNNKTKGIFYAKCVKMLEFIRLNFCRSQWLLVLLLLPLLFIQLLAIFITSLQRQIRFALPNQSNLFFSCIRYKMFDRISFFFSFHFKNCECFTFWNTHFNQLLPTLMLVLYFNFFSFFSDVFISLTSFRRLCAYATQVS